MGFTGNTVATEIDAQRLRDWLADGDEIALIDVREGGAFARSHLLAAANVPLSQLETRVPLVLPRRHVRVILMDEDGSLSARAATLLHAHGYARLWRLAGGVPAWAAAGYELFSGTHVESKAFGEYIEHEHETPRVEPDDLCRWRTEGRDLLIVDARPLEEFRIVSIPGAVDCPGAELVLRVPGLLNSETTTVVVNCAGRTRSIIGCQSLIDAGLPNPVFALKNGTMGWQLAGLQPDSGRDLLAPEPSDPGLKVARTYAKNVAERFGVRFIDSQQLSTLQSDISRTTYLFDVRLPEAFVAGHRAGSTNAPGGQLVQATDVFAPVRGARVILIDRHLVQAVMTAHWLQQMNRYEVWVLTDGLEGPLETGSVPVPGLGEAALTAPGWTPEALHDALRSGNANAVDVGDSYGYRNGRIPGAFYAMRSKLSSALERFDHDQPVVFVCSDGRLSRFAAQDALALGFLEAGYLEGGRKAWQTQGHAVESCGMGEDPLLLTETDDMWYPPYARVTKVEEAMKQYITWEVDLLEQVEKEPYVSFGPIDPRSN